MSFFQKDTTHRPRIVVVFDIGSASVGGGLLLLRHNAKPHILYQTRQDIVFQKDFDFDRFLGSMQTTLEAVALDIVKNGLPHLALGKKRSRKIDEVVVSYASLWYISRTKEVAITREKPFLFTKDMVHDIVRKEEKKMIDHVPDEYQDVTADQVVVIERDVTNIRMNGYVVEEPYGKETQNVTLSLSVTLMAEPFKALITETIEQHLQAKDIRHKAFTSTGLTILQKLFPKQHDFLFIDVSGEVADIACVRGGALQETVSFPTGTRHIIRSLIEQLDSSAHEVETLLGLHDAGAMSADEHARVEKALGTVQTKWGSAFTDALTMLRTHGSVPTRIFLTTDMPLIPFFSIYFEDAARTEGWNTTFLDTKMLSQYVASREREITDAFIALIGLSIHTVDAYGG